MAHDCRDVILIEPKFSGCLRWIAGSGEPSSGGWDGVRTSIKFLAKSIDYIQCDTYVPHLAEFRLTASLEKANTGHQVDRLCRALDRRDILEDPRWNTPEGRKENAAALGSELPEVFAIRPALQWEAVLDEADVPAARVRRMDEVLLEGQLQARGIMSEIMLPDYDKRVNVPSVGFKTNGDVTEPDEPPPQLARDTETMLRAVSSEKIALPKGHFVERSATKGHLHCNGLDL